MQNQSKFGYIKIIFGCVIALVAVLCGIYFLSDVQREKFNEHYTEFSKWTDANKAKYPELYLNACERACDKALESLRTSKITIIGQRDSIKKEIDTAKQEVKAGDKFIVEMKSAFTKAEADNSFPFALLSKPDKSFGKEMAMREVISVNNQVEKMRKFIVSMEAKLAELDVGEIMIQDNRIELQQRKQDIALARVQFKNEKAIGDVAKQLSSLGTTLSATLGTLNDDGPVTLKDLVKHESITIDETKFREILNK